MLKEIAFNLFIGANLLLAVALFVYVFRKQWAKTYGARDKEAPAAKLVADDQGVIKPPIKEKQSSSDQRAADEDFAFAAFALLYPRYVGEGIGNPKPLQPSREIANKDERPFALARSVEIINDARQGKQISFEDLRWVQETLADWIGLRSQVGRFYLNPPVSCVELDTEIQGYVDKLTAKEKEKLNA